MSKERNLEIILEAERLRNDDLERMLREERNDHDGEAQQWRRDAERLARLEDLILRVVRCNNARNAPEQVMWREGAAIAERRRR